MGIQEIIQAFGPSALPAVAVLLAVRMLLRFQADSLKDAREERAREFDKIMGGLSNLMGVAEETKDVAEATRDVAEETRDNAVETLKLQKLFMDKQS